MGVESAEYRGLRMELLDLQNDLSWYHSQQCRHGPEREDWAKQQRARIKAKMEERDRCEREGRRWV